MLGGLFNVLIAAGVLVLVLWIGYAVLKKYWPAAASSTAGTMLGSLVDTTQAWSAYSSLTAIRYLDSVEADPKAMEAVDYLRVVITAWSPKPKAVADTTVVVPAGYKLVPDTTTGK